MTNQELDLVQTDDLVNALKRRFDETVLLGRKKVDASNSNLLLVQSGDLFSRVGLLRIATTSVNQQVRLFLGVAKEPRE